MINCEEIFVNKSYWENMSKNELDLFALKIFHYYRERGFPYYPNDKENRIKEFEKLKKFDYTKVYDSDIIKQTMHGLALAWSYFPHSFNVRCNNAMTPFEAFMDDEIFMKVIYKRLKIGTYISDSGIRKMLRIYTGIQSVSNFRPTAAAVLYHIFAKNGVVWDMCGGWGGRMLGAIVGGVDTYIATEPSTLTYEGLNSLANDFHGEMKYQIYKMGSEDFKPEKNSLDLCFTSPPYFDLEKYSEEETQSYIKFNTKKKWINGYLLPTFENCYYGLKSNKYLLINIADVKNKGNINLEEETLKTAIKCGFNYIKTLKLALSNVNMRNKNEKFKYEPIFVFKK